MTLLHVKLNGPSTSIDLPSSVRNPRFRLKSYRVLFNRDNHGYYYGTLKCTLFNDGNSISFTRRGDANTYFNEIPLILDPEGKHTVRENVDIDLGAVRTASNVRFDLNFFNCIERSRFDQAIFSSPDAAIQGLYDASSFQKYFGTSIPMYPVPTANQTDQVTSFPTPQDFKSVSWYAADGTRIITGSDKIYPDATVWVHTGVQVGNVDPQPGGKDYDERPINQTEANVIDKSVGALKGSGFRKNAIIYAYSVDLIFEITSN
jgi:hypothetical protein